MAFYLSTHVPFFILVFYTKIVTSENILLEHDVDFEPTKMYKTYRVLAEDRDMGVQRTYQNDNVVTARSTKFTKNIDRRKIHHFEKESMLPSINSVMTSELSKDSEYITKDSQNGQIIKTKPENDAKLKFVSEKIGKTLIKISHHLEETSKSLIKRLCKVHGRKSICYQRGYSKCVCIGGMADCSGKPYVPNMPFIPRLPEVSKCLTFTHNNVRSLTESYFANVSKIIVLDFSSNNLIKVSKKTFQRFTNLQYLILNHNRLSYKYLGYVFKYPPKLRLDLIDLALEQIPQGYFLKYDLIQISQIFWDYNYFNKLDLSEFSSLTNLQYLSVTNCSIHYLTTTYMPKLKVLDLSLNRLLSFPVTCIQGSNHIAQFKNNQLMQIKNSSLFPSLKDLYLSNNDIFSLPDTRNMCLPKVDNLHLSSNNINTIPSHAFVNMTSLEVLMFNKMKLGISSIGHSAFGSPSLVSLLLSKSGIHFGSRNISLDMFKGCSSLKVLYLDNNPVGALNSSDLTRLLSHAKTVVHFYIGDAGLTIFPTQALAQLTQMTNLYIYLNHIQMIPHGALDGLSSLTRLQADQNEITVVGEMSPETKKRLTWINLSRNKFLCNCDLLPFQAWLKKSGPTVFHNYTKYFCSDRPRVLIQDYILSYQACILSKRTYIIFVICLSIIIMAFLVFVFLYRYRWDIRLSLYERSTLTRNLPDVTLEGEEFQYDLFIVYCNDDCDWVEEELLSRVEETWSLRACIHRRDFKAGMYITDNCVEAMNSSRRVLVVLSSQFACSNWCNYELKLCQSHIITHDLPSLLVVKLDNIERRDMSSAMLALYNTTCFLEFDRDNSDNFWRRLEGMLQTLIHTTDQKCVG